jgi:hypothetical protein
MLEESKGVVSFVELGWEGLMHAEMRFPKLDP